MLCCITCALSCLVLPVLSCRVLSCRVFSRLVYVLFCLALSVFSPVRVLSLLRAVESFHRLVLSACLACWHGHHCPLPPGSSLHSYWSSVFSFIGPSFLFLNRRKHGLLSFLLYSCKCVAVLGSSSILKK